MNGLRETESGMPLFGACSAVTPVSESEREREVTMHVYDVWTWEQLVEGWVVVVVVVTFHNLTT